MAMEDLIWNRSSFCESNGCVHVAMEPRSAGDPVVYVRSDHGDQVLVFTAAEWRTFIAGVKAAEFDV